VQDLFAASIVCCQWWHNVTILRGLLCCAVQVLVGAHAVLANGGVIAPAGIHMVALAAKRHSVPFVVLVGLHKLSPLFPHDPDVTFNGKHFGKLCLLVLASWFRCSVQYAGQ
jgi:translation initiation factor 2B subunit (eIF-2B alpha/beta/delta family)